MTSTYTCNKCSKQSIDRDHNARRFKHIFIEYLCQVCEPADFPEELKFDLVLTDVHHDETRNLIDYLLGLFIHTGLIINNTLVLIPGSGPMNIILKEFTESSKLLVKYVNKMNIAMYVTTHELIVNRARQCFQDSDNTRLITKCDMTQAKNPSFFRALVDCNYKGDASELVLSYPQAVADCFPPANAKYSESGYEHRVYKDLQLVELLGSVYEQVIAYQCLTTYMQSTYPKSDDFNRAPSAKEIDDLRYIHKFKEAFPFFIPDTMAMFIQLMDPKTLRFVKADPKAVIPTKAHPTDAGFDMTLINKVWTKGIYSMYDTGIIVIPSRGTYTQIVGRSSIYKSGHSLANAIGIIDPTYRGTLRVILRKDDPEADDIILPVQLTPCNCRYLPDYTPQILTRSYYDHHTRPPSTHRPCPA